MSIHPRHANAAVTLLTAALACAGLGACGRGWPAENWEGPQLKAEPELHVTEYRQEVRFLPGSTTLAPDNEAALRRFLSGVGGGYRVYVVTDAADRSGLAARRGRAVATLLASNRIQSQSRFTDEEAPPIDGVAVVVQRSIVALPPCPNWSQAPNRGFNNQPMSNWSCATAVNFGLMLADPSDLARGRDPGYADGEAVARSVENYRKGKTKDIIRDAASSEIFPAVSPSNSSNSGK